MKHFNAKETGGHIPLVLIPTHPKLLTLSTRVPSGMYV